MFIYRNLLKNMMKQDERFHTDAAHRMLWLLAYTFLLRVPSEAGSHYKALACIALLRCSFDAGLANLHWQ